MGVTSVCVCLPDLNWCVAQRLALHVRDAAAQLHHLARSPPLTSPYQRQVSIRIPRLHQRIERTCYQVSQTDILTLAVSRAGGHVRASTLDVELSELNTM